MRAVTRAPMNTPRTSPAAPIELNFWRNATEDGPRERVSLSNPSPMKSNANPIKQSAKL